MSLKKGKLNLGFFFIVTVSRLGWSSASPLLTNGGESCWMTMTSIVSSKTKMHHLSDAIRKQRLGLTQKRVPNFLRKRSIKSDKKLLNRVFFAKFSLAAIIASLVKNQSMDFRRKNLSCSRFSVLLAKKFTKSGPYCCKISYKAQYKSKKKSYHYCS